MLRKLIDNLGYLGTLLLLGGYFYYSVNNVWTWPVQTAVYGGLALIVLYVAAKFPDIRAKLGTRTGKHGTTAGATLLLVVGILVVLNFLNYRHSKRVDLTENQLFALSDQSRKVVQNLENDIQVIGFYQSESGARSFQDQMSEYRYASSRVNFQVVDPQKEPGKVTQYEISRDGQIVILSGEKRETIDEASEEKITNALIKITREGEKVVYFLQGHGERDINDSGAEGYSVAREAIQKQNYRVEPYNLAQENKLPEGATLMISAGPQIDFFPNEIELLKTYLAGGGKFLLMVDPQNDFKMADFLSQYGLSLGHNVVIDASGVGRLFGLGVAAPLVNDYASHPVNEGLSNVMTFFPMAQSVATATSSLGAQTQTLLSTSSRSWGETQLAGNEAAYDEGADTLGPLHIAAAATLKVEASKKEDAQPAPGSDSPADEAGTEAGSEAGAGTEGEGTEGEETEAAGGGEMRLVVYGDSDFANNSYFGSAGNGDLFLNTVSWLAEDADLIAIRPKNPEDRRVNLSASQARLVLWGTVIFLPLATLIFGIAIWYRRR